MTIEKINITDVQNDETNVNWYQNGEDADEEILARPTKQVAEIVNDVIDQTNENTENIEKNSKTKVNGVSPDENGDVTIKAENIEDVNSNDENKKALVPRISENSSIDVPIVDTENRPIAPEHALMNFNPDEEEFEGFNPVTGEWGTIGGSGFIKPIYKSANFSIAANKAYLVDVSDDNDKLITVDTSLLKEGSWFTILLSGVTGLDGVLITLQANAGEWCDVDEDVSSLYIEASSNSIYTFQYLSNKLKVVSGIGENPEINTIKNLMATLNPVGEVKTFATKECIPNDSFYADGSEKDRIIYAELFEKIGTIYGEGDGITTFNLPDYRSEFLRGWDDGRGVDVDRLLGSWQKDELKSHSHTVPHSAESGSRGGHIAGAAYSASSRSTYASGGSETRPRNIAVVYAIRYKTQ